MEEKIVAYLRETYDPVAIILHGSRASGHARAHSDWDFALLYNVHVDLPDNGRAEELGENIEFTHHQLPVTDVIKEFSVKLQNARVVYENGTVGTELLPLAWTSDEKRSHSLWVQGRIDGMTDTVDEPLVFEKYAADFYSRITNYWYWAIHDKYPKPIYLALQEIAEKDPEYFTYIEKFVHGSNKEKVIQAENISQKCFCEI